MKEFEKVVRAHIVSYMKHHQPFNSYQHGFRGGHSCLSQLLNHFDMVTSLLDPGKSVDVVFFFFYAFVDAPRAIYEPFLKDAPRKKGEL